MKCRLCESTLDVTIRKHLGAAHQLTFEVYEKIIQVIDGDAELIELVPLDAVTPDPENANTHNAHNIDTIKNSILRFGGQITPATVNEAGLILKGNGTYQAVTELLQEARLPASMYHNGRAIFKIIRRDLSGHEAVAYSLVDNKSGHTSTLDTQLVSEYMKAMQADGYEIKGLGWKTHEIDLLMAADWKKPNREQLPETKTDTQQAAAGQSASASAQASAKETVTAQEFVTFSIDDLTKAENERVNQAIRLAINNREGSTRKQGFMAIVEAYFDEP